MSSDISQISASPIPFTHNGKTFSVSLLKQDRKVQFEQWVREQAFRALKASKPYISEEEYAEDKANLQMRMERGYYSYHGPICQAAQSTQGGSLALASILFGCGEDEMVQIAATRGDEVKDILARVIADSMPAQKNGTVPVPANASSPDVPQPVPNA